MTREEAFKLAGEVADAGFSVQVAIGVHRDHGENISVHVRAMRFEAVALQALIETGAKHGLELHLIGDDLRFVEVHPSARLR